MSSVPGWFRKYRASHIHKTKFKNDFDVIRKNALEGNANWTFLANLFNRSLCLKLIYHVTKYEIIFVHKNGERLKYT